ncbi:lipopolysaccharide biosynthesis protein [Angustibacter luteus]|uniref:Lipopolysaccharide biosynthesis protein n=1 Tax=Angustibacter luteus TaxID=658456 RepID=A0ABW1JG57_9ACTN
MTPGPATIATMFRPLRLDQPTVGSMRARGVLSTIGIGLQGVLRFVLSVAIGRIGGPAVLGVVNSAISAALFLSLLWPASAGAAGSKFVARARGAGDFEEATVVAAHLGRRTAASTAVLALVAVAGWATIGHGGVEAGLCVAALVVGYSGYAFTRGVQFGAGQVARATYWDVTSVLLGLGGVLVALAAGVRGTALVLPLAGAYLVYTVAGYPHGVHGRPTRVLRRELDGFVLLGVTASMASGGVLQLSMVVARVFDSAAAAGQYASALALATPASLLASSLNLVLFPAMAESWGRGDVIGFRRQTDYAMRLLLLVLVGVFGSLALCSPMLGLIFGPKYAQAEELLPILLLGVLAVSVAVVPSTAITTRSQRGMVIYSATCVGGLLVGILTWLALVPGHGVLGVAVGNVVAGLVVAVVPTAIVWRDGQRWLALMVRTVLAVAAVGALLALRQAVDLSLWVDVVLVPVFLGTWLAVSAGDVRTVLLPLLRRRRPMMDPG